MLGELDLIVETVFLNWAARRGAALPKRCVAEERLWNFRETDPVRSVS